MIESSKRLYVLLGVAAALLLVAVVLPKLLFSGGEPVEDLSAPVLPTASTGTPPPPPAAPAPAGTEPVETFEVFTTKNPFTPLVASEPIVETPAFSPPAPSGEAAPVATTPAPAPAPTPAPAPSVTAPTPDPVGASGGSATAPRPQQRVAVLEVFTDAAGAPRASVRVNDTVYDVGQGERFATSYQVVELAVDEGCGQFLFGDDRFRVCEGEELLK